MLSTGSVIDETLSEYRGRMPILESLTVYIFGTQSKKCHTTFEIAPHLTELNLELSKGTYIRFPWAQLTKLRLTLSHISGGFATGNELHAFLLPLQNVEDLQFTIPYFDIALANLKCPPVRLTRLQSLKLSVGVASVAFSWLETPFLERLLLDSQYLGISDAVACRKEITSLIGRSSCRIRQLTLESCFGEIARCLTYTLVGVEELYIMDFGQIPRIVRYIADRTYLPKMRVFQVDCCPGCFRGLVADLSRLSKARSKESTESSTCDIAPLERLKIRVGWDCEEPCCTAFNCGSRTQIVSALQAISSWPSFSVTDVHSDQSNKWSITLNARALAAGTLIDLTFYRPHSDLDIYVDEYCSCQSVLENMCVAI